MTEKDTKFSSTNQPSDGARNEGRGKRKVMTEALMLALNRESENADGKMTKRLNQIADKLAENAAQGDNTAIKEVFDRTEGKAAQALTLAAPDGGPILLWGTKPE